MKIFPCLWFENNGRKALDFYLNLFEGTYIERVDRYHKFEIFGKEMLIDPKGCKNRFNETAAFILRIKGEKNLLHIWNALEYRGKVIIPYNKYPFNEILGWVEDRYGVTWQIILSEADSINPFLMFSGKYFAHSQEAMHYYNKVLNIKEVKVFPELNYVDNCFYLYDNDVDYDNKLTITESFHFVIFGKKNEFSVLKNDCVKSLYGLYQDKYHISWNFIETK